MGTQTSSVQPRSLLVVTAIFVFVFMMSNNSSHSSGKIPWKEIDSRELLAANIPQDIVKKAQDGSGVVIEEKTINVKGVNMFYLEAAPQGSTPPTGQTLLLLHGAAFKSETWRTKVHTIQTMALLGHRVIAVDLPGFGRTEFGGGDKATFLASAIRTLNLQQPVIVSPSMSGSFSLPLLVSEPDLFGGYIPVAPVGPNQYTDKFPDIYVPTMIVYGELDRTLGLDSNRTLSLLPLATKGQVLRRARHPAYLDQPDVWHQLIFNFMRLLKEDQE